MTDSNTAPAAGEMTDALLEWLCPRHHTAPYRVCKLCHHGGLDQPGGWPVHPSYCPVLSIDSQRLALAAAQERVKELVSALLSPGDRRTPGTVEVCHKCQWAVIDAPSRLVESRRTSGRTCICTDVDCPLRPSTPPPSATTADTAKKCPWYNSRNIETVDYCRGYHGKPDQCEYDRCPLRSTREKESEL